MRPSETSTREDAGSWTVRVLKGAPTAALFGILVVCPVSSRAAVPVDVAENAIDRKPLDEARLDWKRASEYRPRTELGRRLLEIRKRIIASGGGLRGWDAIEKEIAERRGEANGD